ncbi:MAG: T9SS type A sorting domain-containing protein [Bacteroidota bacterium]
MKRRLLLLLVVMLGTVAQGQTYPEVSIFDIQNVSVADLQACNDTSAFFGDTVTVTGVVLTDGNLAETASGSVQGGYRPQVYICDTGQAVIGSFSCIEVHGVFPGAGGNLPVSALDNLIAGTVVEITGDIQRFAGHTQINPLSNSAVVPLSIESVPQPLVLNVGDLNDDQRVNELPTGEQWESAYIEIQNVTVTSVNIFSGNRISFDVADQNGNLINISDRFLVQHLPSWTTVNPSSPATTGSFVAPAVGTNYNFIRGIARHSENGCTGAGGRGYELNPFDASHYDVGVTPPNISEVGRDPVVPTSTDVVTISATITDVDGTVTSQTLHYTDDPNAAAGAFTVVNMSLVGGTTDEYEADIPAFADGTLVRYFIEADDDGGNTTTAPFTPAGQTVPNVFFYTVRDNGLSIPDLQLVINPTGDASQFLGEEVTVDGIVTGATKPFGLGSVFIQDETATEWAGIMCVGNSDLTTLFRGERVRITGTVQENFGFTRLSVSPGGVERLDTTCIALDPVILDPSDSAGIASGEWEKYESMLVAYVNTGGGQVHMTNPQLNPFADYTVGSSASANFANSATVQAGRFDNNNFSSLWVSLVSDPQWELTDGEMEVPPVITALGQTFDTLQGVLAYSFGLYKLLPRNNADLIGFSETLEPVPADTTCNPGSGSGVGIDEVIARNAINVFPNPANAWVRIEAPTTNQPLRATVLDLTGRTITTTRTFTGSHVVDVQSLNPGMYFLRVTDVDGTLIGGYKVLINR